MPHSICITVHTVFESIIVQKCTVIISRYCSGGWVGQQQSECCSDLENGMEKWTLPQRYVDPLYRDWWKLQGSNPSAQIKFPDFIWDSWWFSLTYDDTDLSFPVNKQMSNSLIFHDFSNKKKPLIFLMMGSLKLQLDNEGSLPARCKLLPNAIPSWQILMPVIVKALFYFYGSHKWLLLELNIITK